jgi:hypothetical protein
MQSYSGFALSRKVAIIAALVASASLLAACNGASSSSPIISGAAGNSYVRFVAGSPDAGPVDVYLDGSAMVSAQAYGSITPFHRVNTGSHSVTIYAAGSDTGAGLASTTFSTSAATDVSIVLTGEQHPSYQGTSDLAVVTFVNGQYNTVADDAGVNFYHASPIFPAAAGYNTSTVQFGYSVNATPSLNSIDSAVALNGQTNVQTLPGGATNVPITLYAVNTSTVSIEASQVSSSCSNNELPCTTPNLSLYLVDGPAASTSPTTPPAGVSGSAKATFFGVFDANGLLVQ